MSLRDASLAEARARLRATTTRVTRPDGAVRLERDQGRVQQEAEEEAGVSCDWWTACGVLTSDWSRPAPATWWTSSPTSRWRSCCRGCTSAARTWRGTSSSSGSRVSPVLPLTSSLQAAPDHPRPQRGRRHQHRQGAVELARGGAERGAAGHPRAEDRQRWPPGPGRIIHHFLHHSSGVRV